MQYWNQKTLRQTERFWLTSMCLSSSLSRVGYLSSLVKGLLRLVVRVRIPGLDAPFDSMYSPSSSLWCTHTRQAHKMLYIHTHIFLFSLLGREFCFVVYTTCTHSISVIVPVLGEYIDSSRMAGAVGHIEDLHLGHQIQEEPPYPLLALWESAHTQVTC